MAIKIDPKTGERIEDAPQIDPQTGERVATPTPPVDMSNVAGAGPTPLPQPAAHPAVNMQPRSTASVYGSVAGDLAKGAAKGAGSTANNIGHALIPDRLVSALGATPPSEQQQQSYFAPSNTTQSVGKGIEQAGEFLIPGAAEEKLGMFGASKLPMLGKYAAPVAKLGAKALGAGAVNSAQGGSFGGGAAAGAAGGLFGMGLQKVAPMLAETALGVRAGDRAYGRTPGQGILSETTGVKPGAIANQATQKVGLLNNELQSAAAASPMTASLAPARQVVDSAYNNALLENEDQTIKGIGKLQNQLQQWSGQPGAANIAPIPQDVTPSQLLSLKRGVGSFRGSFNPATTPGPVDAAAGRAYHALDTELDRTVPGAADINQRISTLLPVAQRAGAADLNAGTVQRMVGRLKSHTGALIAPLTAASVGAAQHGPLGGLIGGTAGLFGQEVLASPTVQMGAARLANSPLTQKAIPGFVGAGLQAAPKRKGLFQ